MSCELIFMASSVLPPLFRFYFRTAHSPTDRPYQATSGLPDQSKGVVQIKLNGILLSKKKGRKEERKGGRKKGRTEKITALNKMGMCLFTVNLGGVQSEGKSQDKKLKLKPPTSCTFCVTYLRKQTMCESLPWFC